jgi:hypothetical protein
VVYRGIDAIADMPHLRRGDMVLQLLCHRLGDANHRFAVACQAFIECGIESKGPSVGEPIMVCRHQSAGRVPSCKQRVEGGFVLVTVNQIGLPRRQVFVQSTHGRPVELPAASDDNSFLNIRSDDIKDLLVGAAIIVENTEIDINSLGMQLAHELGRHGFSAVKAATA